MQHQAQFVVSDGSTRINATSIKEVGASVAVEETIANAGTNVAVTVAVPLTGLKTFALCSDKDVTVKTNSSGSPDDTYTLKANQALVWQDGLPNNPVTAAITILYITNASGASAVVKLIAGWDPTP